jgi:hypothetical protein
MRFHLLITCLCLSAPLAALPGCRTTPDYRNMRIDPMEKELGYLTAENGHNVLPFILGGYTKGPKSLVYSVPLLSWYVNSKQHKGFAFLAPFIVYDIDFIYYASDNRMAGYKNVNFWFLGLIGSTRSLTGVHPRGEEVERSSYWFFPLFMGGTDEEGPYFKLLMLIPIF